MKSHMDEAMSIKIGSRILKVEKSVKPPSELVSIVWMYFAVK